MHEFVKHFLKENIQLIDDENWAQLYNVARAAFSYADRMGQMTEFIMSCGCNVFEGKNRLEIIPTAFLASTGKEQFTIPEHITFIGFCAFAHCNFKEITIPSNVTEIKRMAFLDNSKLEHITINTTQLPAGSTEIVFKDCINIQDIKFVGTMNQWRAMKPALELRMDTYVVCSDGTITYDEDGEEVRA